MVEESGYVLGNVDCTIMAQRPKMAPYIEQMRNRIAELLNADPSQVNVKATTTEKLGFTGREEGIAAMATILLIKNNSIAVCDKFRQTLLLFNVCRVVKWTKLKITGRF